MRKIPVNSVIVVFHCFVDLHSALQGVGYFGASKEDGSEAEEVADTDAALTKNYNSIPKFLNRILGLPVDLQNRVFKHFMDTLGVIISEAKKAGRYDKGIMDLGTQHDSVRRIKSNSFTIRHPTGTSKIVLDTVEMDRGISWEKAKEMEALLIGDHEGFYLSTNPVTNV